MSLNDDGWRQRIHQESNSMGPGNSRRCRGSSQADVYTTHRGRILPAAHRLTHLTYHEHKDVQRGASLEAKAVRGPAYTPQYLKTQSIWKGGHYDYRGPSILNPGDTMPPCN